MGLSHETISDHLAIPPGHHAHDPCPGSWARSRDCGSRTGPGTLDFTAIDAYIPAQQVRDLHSVRLNRPVGATFEYVNANYATLGLIVQTVSEQSYKEYVQQQVFAPLDMRHSFTSRAEAQPNGLASDSRYWFGVPSLAHVADTPAERTNGRLIASAEDMAHFLIAQLNDGQYAGAALLSQLASPRCISRPSRSGRGPPMAWDGIPANAMG